MLDRSKSSERYPIPDCKAAQGLSYDATHDRLFLGCDKELVIVDARKGHRRATHSRRRDTRTKMPSTLKRLQTGVQRESQRLDARDRA